MLKDMEELPPHWEIAPDDNYFSDDGRDYHKPMFTRKDGLARVYYNLGEENTPYMFAICWNDDGDCAPTLHQAIARADAYVNKHLL